MTGFRLVLGFLLLALTNQGVYGLQSAVDPTATDAPAADVVESPFPDTTEAPLWRISDEPMVSIGQLDGPEEYVLHRVSGAVAHDEGIVVINAMGTELRFYDLAGEYLRTIGQRGQGPGEFSEISVLRQLKGGRWLVVDPRNQRISIFDSEGDLLEEQPIERLRPSGALGNGNIVGYMGAGWSRRSYGEGIAETTARVQIFDRATGVFDTIASVRGPTWYARSSGENSMRTRIIPFSSDFDVAVGESRIAVGWSGEPSVTVFDASGRPLHVIRWDQPVRPVTDDHIERMIEPLSEDRQRSLRQLLREMPVAETIPVYDQLLLGGDGALWVRLVGVDDESQHRWLKFNADGTSAGWVDVPRQLSVQSIGVDQLTGVWYDELGVPSIQLFRLAPSGG